jgi:hypothetical protein
MACALDAGTVLDFAPRVQAIKGIEQGVWDLGFGIWDLKRERAWRGVERLPSF